MKAGEVQAAFKRAGLDCVTVAEARGGNGYLTLLVHRDRVAEVLQRILPPAAPPAAPPVAAAPPQAAEGDMPEELEHALDVAPDHDFVVSCQAQWEERRWLSEAQLAALGRFRNRGRSDS